MPITNIKIAVRENIPKIVAITTRTIQTINIAIPSNMFSKIFILDTSKFTLKKCYWIHIDKQ